MSSRVTKNAHRFAPKQRRPASQQQQQQGASTSSSQPTQANVTTSNVQHSSLTQQPVGITRRHQQVQQLGVKHSNPVTRHDQVGDHDNDDDDDDEPASPPLLVSTIIDPPSSTTLKSPKRSSTSFKPSDPTQRPSQQQQPSSSSIAPSSLGLSIFDSSQHHHVTQFMPTQTQATSYSDEPTSTSPKRHAVMGLPTSPKRQQQQIGSSFSVGAHPPQPSPKRSALVIAEQPKTPTMQSNDLSGSGGGGGGGGNELELFDSPTRLIVTTSPSNMFSGGYSSQAETPRKQQTLSTTKNNKGGQTRTITATSSVAQPGPGPRSIAASVLNNESRLNDKNRKPSNVMTDARVDEEQQSSETTLTKSSRPKRILKPTTTTTTKVKTTTSDSRGKGKAKQVSSDHTEDTPNQESTATLNEPIQQRLTRKTRASKTQQASNSGSVKTVPPQQQSDLMMSLAFASRIVEGEIDHETAQRLKEQQQQQQQQEQTSTSTTTLTQGKKRGRPKKNQITNEQDEPVTKIRKKRGRPRKDQQKQDQENEQSQNDEQAMSIDESSTKTINREPSSRQAKNKARQNLTTAHDDDRNSVDQDQATDMNDEDQDENDNQNRDENDEMNESDEDVQRYNKYRRRRTVVKRRGNVKQGKSGPLLLGQDEIDQAPVNGQDASSIAADDQDGQQSEAAVSQEEGQADEGESEQEQEQQTSTNQKGPFMKPVILKTVDPTVTTLKDIADPIDNVSGRIGPRSIQINAKHAQMKALVKQNRKDRNKLMKKRAARRLRGQPEDQDTEPEQDDLDQERAAPVAGDVDLVRLRSGQQAQSSPAPSNVGANLPANEQRDDSGHDSDPEFNSDDDQVKQTERRNRRLEAAERAMNALENDATNGDGDGSGDEDAEEDTFQETQGAQVQVVNGRIVINVDSLQIDRRGNLDNAPGALETIEESAHERFINSATHAGYQRPAKWSADETELFYEGVRQFGTDFEMIAGLFPNRNRRQIKTKWNKEDKTFPQKITAALMGKKAIDLNEYSKRTGHDLSGPVPEDPMDEINARRRAEAGSLPDTGSLHGGRSVSVKVKKREATTPGAALNERQTDGDDVESNNGDETVAAGGREGDDDDESETEAERIEREEAREREIQNELAAAGAETGAGGRKKKKRG
ncbi:hypothetical protein OIO90_001774 [Microbotryomycetes sp. JL221]|nr:hypothetical protein OIO90_001774 [Microbotryomycetes sp. JL221]